MDDDFKIMTEEDDLTKNERIPLKNRLFNFYYQINKKNDINEVVTSIFIIIETIQQISYVFSEPLYSLWRIKNEKTGEFIQKIITATRISQLFRLVKFNVFLTAWIALTVLLFAFILSIAVSIQINNMKFFVFRFNVILGSYCFNTMNGVLLVLILETLLSMKNVKIKKLKLLMMELNVLNFYIYYIYLV